MGTPSCVMMGIVNIVGKPVREMLEETCSSRVGAKPEAIAVALVGVVSGGIASLVAPWAQWGVEKRREQLAHRRALVQSWRAGVAEFAAALTDYSGATHDTEYLEREWYLSLRSRLASEPTSWDPDALGDEIARIERGWDLA